MKPKGALFLLAAGVLIAAPVALRPPADSFANALAKAAVPQSRGELVGKVLGGTSVRLRHLQMEASRLQWTLNVPKNTPIVGKDGGSISVHDIKVGTYIRATGLRIGNTRMQPDHLWVIGDRLDMTKSPYYKRGKFAGYIRRISP